jgi:[acyl-carrier-protein] S-malonyltransferase
MDNAESVSSLKSVFAVFPGQGSQHSGMGKDLFENFSIAREVYEEASDSIHTDLKKLCFEGSESDLALTHNTQPCLLVTSVAAFRVAEKEMGFVPSAVAGHSLGEYSALVAIRSLDLASATRWVRERGLAMQKAVPVGLGTMAAVLGLEDEQVELLCKQATQSAVEKRQKGEVPEMSVPAVVEPANFNAPGQIVIAGSKDAVDEAIRLIQSGEDFKRGKAIPLQVSAPFHCQLMTPARDRMAELFALCPESQKPKTPLCSYVPNRTARLSHEAGLIFELLIEQIDHPVLWKQSINTLLNQSFSTSVEFGAGKVLSGLIKRIATQSSKNCTFASVTDTSSLKSLEKTLSP